MKPATDNLRLLFKSLWGASTVPFCAGAKPAFEHPDFEALSAKINQLCAIGSSGVLHGPNGSGKSYLINYLLESRLSERQFKTLVLTHSSLSGSDLLRALSLALEIRPKFRRSDNVAAITDAWNTLGSRWPVLIVEEKRHKISRPPPLKNCACSPAPGSIRSPSVWCWSVTMGFWQVSSSESMLRCVVGSDTVYN
jgi:AAA domain